MHAASTPGQTTYGVCTRTLVEVVALVLLVAIPASVHAGVFKKVAAFWQEPAKTKELLSESSPAPATAPVILSAATHSDPQAARGGGDVIVEDGAIVSRGFAADDDRAESSNNGEISVYTVRPGDTPSQIAEMFDVSVNTIYWANDIANGVIQPGDSLVILPITGVRHVVKSGETLSDIAKKYDGDIDEILAYNQLSSADALSPGDTVVVPHGEVATAPPRAIASGKSTSGGGSTVSSAGFMHPVPGARRTQGIHGYNAVDLAAPVGTPIRAAAAGEVIVSKGSGWNGGYGRYIVIKHPNGTQTLYAHNSSNAVGVGAYVAAGETIGYVGSSGRSTGAHVHFEVRGTANPF